jgi:hypothetical protein
MNNKNWLDNLAVGDKVCYDCGMMGRDFAIGTVERLTKTQVIVNNGSKYRRSNGERFGGSAWDIQSIREPTKERILMARKCIIRNRISRISRSDNKTIIQALTEGSVLELENALKIIERVLGGGDE